MAKPHDGSFRRPLKSKTYSTFLRVLSLSHHPSFTSPLLQDDNVSQKAQELCSTQSHNTLSGSKSVCDDKKEGDRFLDVQSSIDLLECKNDKKENPGFDESVDLLVDEGNGSDPVSRTIHESNDEHCTLEVRSGSFSPGREFMGNGDFSVKEVFEAIDCSLNLDEEAELSKLGESVEQEVALVEQNMSLEIEQELQLKEMELEKLIMGSDFVGASPLVGVCEEMEEGEISSDMGADDMLVDMLSKDDILPTVEKAKELEAFKYSSDGEEVACDVGQSEIEKNKGHSSLLLDEITSKNDIMEVDGKRSGEMNGSCLLETSGAKERSGEVNCPAHLAVASDCLAPAGNIKSESIAENQSSAAAEKDDGAPKKKRTPLTKERRAKKKKRDKIKRAEKDRMLGVQRLKFQPMVKPKVVAYCRHYLKGKCQEGEKCKFSHDTVPLTKSTPCCHFARHSCMKGDDCPFDHQLSKYPCNNITSKGFCTRGADCLFSHELPAKVARSAVSYASVCEMKNPTSSSPNTKNTEKQVLVHSTTSQKVEAKSCASGLSNVRSNGQHSAIPVKIHSIQPPKGVNILVHGNMSAVPMSKQLDSQISKTDSSDNKVQPVAHNNKKINEVVDVAAAKTPRGINFLSFGKSPTSGANGKVVSNLAPNRDFRTGKSLLFTPSPNKDGAFLSSGNYSSNLIPGGQLNPQPSDGKSSLTSFRGESTSDKSQTPMPSKTTPFPFTFNSAVESEVGIASSSKSPFLSETSPFAHKALHSTLAFAANVEPRMKFDSSKTSSSFGNKSLGSLQSGKPNASTLWDSVYGSNCNLKTQTR